MPVSDFILHHCPCPPHATVAVVSTALFKFVFLLMLSRLDSIVNKTQCLDNSTVGANTYDNGVLVEGVTWYNEPINFDNVLIGYVALFQVVTGAQKILFINLKTWQRSIKK